MLLLRIVKRMRTIWQNNFTSLFFKKNSLLSFFIAFLILCLGYRWVFLISIFQFPIIKPFSAFTTLMLGLVDDLALAILLVVGFFVVQNCFMVGLQKHASLLKKCERLSQVLLLIFFIFLISLFLANKKLFFTLFTGFTYHLLENAWQLGFTPNKYLLFINGFDWIFLLLFVALYLVIEYYLSAKQWAWLLRGLLVSIFISLLIVTYGLLRVDYNSAYIKVLYKNPLSYFVADFFSPTTNYYTNQLAKPGGLQNHQLQLIDPLFSQSVFSNPKPQHNSQKHWNVVVVILESVGLPYVFDTETLHKIPMPFLKKLASQGLWLNNNYTAGNTSILGGFSVLTGLYPSTRPDNFAMQADIQIPTFSTWLPAQYDSIFTMTGDLTYFFQKGLIANTGFKKIDDFSTIPSTRKNFREDKSVNEIDAMNFFLTQLEAAQAPFFAVYWTNATHKPYYDYGYPYRLTADIKNPKMRYLNNLYLLDCQIKRIYEFMQTHRLADNTVLVIVGDHGEGFGQHPDGWMHGATVYQEQIQVPVLFYQPKLFKPKEINTVTSSVDVLPTLFEAVALPYNAKLIQGESLLHHTQKKYAFVYGNEYELVAINRANIKKQISFRDGGCIRYELTKDPHELQPLTCQHDEQEEAMIKFHNYQSDILQRYNLLLKQSNKSNVIKNLQKI